MKYWYLYFETDKCRSWRLWIGRHPLDRLKECPDQIPMFWTEVPPEIAIEKLREMPEYGIENDRKMIAATE